ncbi:MAG: class II fructose-bisphosphate aldolase [Anaerolineaceae bacterium]|nr:class II fructose-bisphosphate aldolase [Anaerolineaceae bacterium]
MCTEATLEQDILELALAPREKRKKLAVQILNLTWENGLYPASIAPVYQALGRGQLAPMTVPAFNVRGLTYPLARAIWRAALQFECGPIIFELAPSESTGCDQTFEEYAALVMAAAFKEGYHGPVFLQGDHFSLDSTDDLKRLEELARQVIESGFYQIDIDGSHLFDQKAENLNGFHAPNAQITGKLIQSIHAMQPRDIHITLGGEVGEIGGRNTSVEDLVAFQAELQNQLPDDTPGLDKISAQTGTTHSGIVLPDGTTGRMSVDFDLISALSKQARQSGWSGLVQHGASTLRIEDLARLPEAGVIEVHLATQIQNILFDHPAFPAALREQMKLELVSAALSAEGDQLNKSEALSEAQRFYQARWAAWGIYKSQLWQLQPEVITQVSDSLADWATAIFEALQINNQSQVLSDYYPGGTL